MNVLGKADGLACRHCPNRSREALKFIILVCGAVMAVKLGTDFEAVSGVGLAGATAKATRTASQTNRSDFDADFSQVLLGAPLRDTSAW